MKTNLLLKKTFLTLVLRSFRFCFYLFGATMAVSNLEGADYSILYDQSNPNLKTVEFGVNDLQSVLEGEGHTVLLLDRSQNAKVGANAFIFRFDETKDDEDFALVINGSRYLIHGGRVGLMYAALEIAENIKNGKGEPKKAILLKKPFLEKRGLKMNIPLDARTPSYADFGTSAHENIRDVWDMKFWEAQLDRMARSRYNTYTLWNLNPFPSLVNLDEPELQKIDYIARFSGKGLSLDGVMTSNIDLESANEVYELRAKNSYEIIAGEDYVSKKINGDDLLKTGRLIPVNQWPIGEKIKFWRKVMQYGHDRGIKFYIFTWNIYLFTELGKAGLPKDIELADNYGDPAQDAVKGYYLANARALLESYPLLAGIGVTGGENASDLAPNKSKRSRKSDAKVDFLMQTYGRATLDYIKEHPDRKIDYIQRLHESGASETLIKELILHERIQVDTSTKYMNAHLLADAKKTSDIDGNTRREIKPIEYTNPNTKRKVSGKVWLNLRNDDLYNLRWGDYHYVKQFYDSVRSENNFNIVRGFHMGPDGYVMGVNYTSKNQARQLEFDKHWLRFALWGRLAYDLNTPKEIFEKEAERRFEISSEQRKVLFDAWEVASQIIPIVNLNFYKRNDYQFHPEVFGRSYERWMSISSLAVEDMDFSDKKKNRISGQGYKNFDDYTRKMRPVAADKLDTLADRIDTILHDEILSSTSGNIEFQETIRDIKAFEELARFYADVFRAAYKYGFNENGKFRRFPSKKEIRKNRNLIKVREASEKKGSLRAGPDATAAAWHWRKYAELMANRYKDQAFGRANTHPWQDLEKEALKDLKSFDVDISVFERIPQIEFVYPQVEANPINIPREIPQMKRSELFKIKISDQEPLGDPKLRVFGFPDASGARYESVFSLSPSPKLNGLWVFKIPQKIKNGKYLFDIAVTGGTKENPSICYRYLYVEIMDGDGE